MLEIIQICYDISGKTSSRNANVITGKKNYYLLVKNISCSVILSILYSEWNRIHNKYGTALRWLMQTWYVKEKSIRWDNRINLKWAFSVFQVLQTLMFFGIDCIFLLHIRNPEFWLLFVICNSLIFLDIPLWSSFTSTYNCTVSLMLHGLKLGQIQPAVL